MKIFKKRERKESGKKRKYIKFTCFFFLCYLIYLIGGAVLPFIQTKKVSEENVPDTLENADADKTPGNLRASILETNADALNYRLLAISEAKERIIISTFDIRPGESWDRISSALYQAAERGVEVQLLVDGAFGMIHMKGNEFYVLGSHENVEIKFYNKPNILKPWTLNGRLHDKYVLADNKYLILGGRNFFDYFLGEYENKSTGHDRDVFIYNAERELSEDHIFGEVENYFEELWEYTKCKTVFDKLPFGKKLVAEKERLARSDWGEKLDISNENEILQETVAIDNCTLLTNPTHIYNKEPLLWQQQLSLMRKAESKVLIQTPYVVLSEDMYEDLRELNKEVPEVEILTNSVASGDNVMASTDYIKSREKVLEDGNTIYEYQGKHSLHGKSIVIDDDISIIGSYNLDMRSTYIDTETMLVIYGEEFNRMLSSNIEEQKKEALLVLQDGTYEEKDDVEVHRIKPKKDKMIHVLSYFTKWFRFLI